MTYLSNGIAHVSFRGGGLFLPLRSPYDRETLAEHVAARARARGEVQVLLDNERWLVCLLRGPSDSECAECRQALKVACYAAGDPEPPYCVTCAFARTVVAAPSRPQRGQTSRSIGERR